MTGRQTSVRQESLDGVRELEQSHRVGHGGAALADPASHLLLRESELLGELVIRRCLLEDAEVLTMEVLHQGLFEREAVLGRSHDRRNALETGELRRTPPSFSGDQLVGLWAGLTHQDRLEHAHRLDRGRESGQRLVVEECTGLERVGLDLDDRQLPELGIALLQPFCGGDEGPEAPTQSASASHR